MERQENARFRAVVWLVVLAVSVTHFVAISASRGRYGYADLPIFFAAADHFSRTGELYPAAGDPEAFRPAAAVYKFPPLFAAFLLPSVRDGVDAGDYVLHWCAQMLLYAAAVAVFLFGVRRRTAGTWLLAGTVAGLRCSIAASENRSRCVALW